MSKKKPTSLNLKWVSTAQSIISLGLHSNKSKWHFNIVFVTIAFQENMKLNKWNKKMKSLLSFFLNWKKRENTYISNIIQKQMKQNITKRKIDEKE